MNKFDIDSKEHFRLIFDQSAIGIAFLAANGRMQKVSKKLWDIFGYSEKELCEMNFLDIINPGESCKEIEQVKELFNGKFDSLWVELSYINRYEITGWISLNATLVRDREGNRSHFICIIEDTTNKKFSEIELKKKTRELERSSKYKSEFLANMSHELRSPLNSMLILSQDLASNSEKNLSEDQVKSAEIIYMGGNDLLTLINEILDLSKIEAGKMILYIDPIRVTDIAKNIELSYAHQVKKKKLFLHLVYDEGIPEFIQSDFQRLNQVFKNLLSNAIKFTREGGITITLKRPSPEIDLFSSGLNPDQTLAIEISDTGIGIPGNVQNAIFEAFQQADGTTSRTYGGTGLGLSISRELTRLLGGEIQLKSVEGEGAAFTVYIPEQLKKSETAHKNKRAKERSILSDLQIPQESKILNGKRVLVVDDDMRNLFAISNILKKINMIVFKAKDGLMALQTLEKESGIDMILMDIMMPVMDGYETIRRIRTMKQFKEIPVIALSAKAMPEDLEKCLSAGANDFLPKPVKVNLLLQKMEKLITPE